MTKRSGAARDLHFHSEKEAAAWERLWERISAAGAEEEPGPFYVRVSAKKGRGGFEPLGDAKPLSPSAHRRLAEAAAPIPAAWSNVILSPSNPKVFGRGVHTEGKSNSVRTVFYYKPAFRTARNEKKHCDLLYFAEQVDKIEHTCLDTLRHLQKNHKENELWSKEAIVATVVLLLINCAFRIGSRAPTDATANRGIFYISPEHVHVRANRSVEIAFRGKWGKENECTLDNELLVRIFRRLLPGVSKHGFVFKPPPIFLDGKPHTVRAYGIDTKGGTNPQLQGCPKTITCKPPAPPPPPPPPPPKPDLTAPTPDAGSLPDTGPIHQSPDRGAAPPAFHDGAQPGADLGPLPPAAVGTGYQLYGGCTVGSRAGTGTWLVSVLTLLGLVARRRRERTGAARCREGASGHHAGR